MWNVVGTITLFKHSVACKDQAFPLWIVSFLSLIFQWMYIVIVIILSPQALKFFFPKERTEMQETPMQETHIQETYVQDQEISLES